VASAECRDTLQALVSAWTPARAIATGTLIVGVLDGLDAVIFFGLRGVSPGRIFQGIAAGAIGREAATVGGALTVTLGVAFHFTVAFCIVSTYFAASRWWPLLTRRAVPCGLAYGVAAYLTMTFVIVPLSAAATFPARLPAWPILVNGLAVHLVGVGLPAAWVAAKAPSRS
jgi:hypothetical protein